MPFCEAQVTASSVKNKCTSSLHPGFKFVFVQIIVAEVPPTIISVLYFDTSTRLKAGTSKCDIGILKRWSNKCQISPASNAFTPVPTNIAIDGFVSVENLLLPKSLPPLTLPLCKDIIVMLYFSAAAFTLSYNCELFNSLHGNRNKDSSVIVFFYFPFLSHFKIIGGNLSNDACILQFV